ncbi:putative polyketide synthase [Rhypophila decipiens]|uniref:Polyketide synthase n=1 Tax=Rhypophila decipiens TaxID=261697 RepID=A0AAN7B5I9_9PEZI|nr:putative polyketide synthase [Rhypophila decipiens]
MFLGFLELVYLQLRFLLLSFLSLIQPPDSESSVPNPTPSDHPAALPVAHPDHSSPSSRTIGDAAKMDRPKTMPIAIIGMSCKFSGDATSPERLWELVSEARSGWTEFPKDRFGGEAFYHPISERLASTQVKGAHFIKQDVGLFDASFFNFSVEVAATMDPQIRLQLESAFEAFENAGLSIEALAGSDTAVFAGEFVKDYYDSLMRDPETVPRFFVTGNGVAMMSARVSHFFDLRGPCLTLDTGCSTGLTALHQACVSIRSGESSMAVVSGSNLLLNPDMFNQMSATGLLSKEGRSFSFDSRGTGYGRGEGVATLVIKPLEDALRDADPIRAVIRETALNQDGKTPTITSPSEEAQTALMRACYERAGLDPAETAYIEAHGTGTRTGDPIEARAIHAVLVGDKSRRQSQLLIGSVKSNIGHTEAASGIAGVIKVVMAFEKGMIPPNFDFQKANPNIPFDEFNMKVPTTATPWPRGLPKRASVNSFGYGGTNGHVILEDPAIHTIPTPVPPETEAGEHQWRRLFRLSGKDETTTKRMVTQLKDYLETINRDSSKDDAQLLNDLAYTLNQRRSRFSWNTAVTAKTKKELIAALDPAAVPLARSESDKPPRLGFVFTGQGAQWHAMGRELLLTYPVFRDAVLEGEQILKDFGCPWSATEELLKDAQTSRVNEVMLSLPLCCVVQLALVRLLRSWGINPSAVTGHSSGEVGAAFAANAVDMREALAVVWSRGTLTEEFQRKVQRKGGMLAAGLSREEAAPYLRSLTSGTVVVACVNSPSSVTLSGDLAAIAELEHKLKQANVFARRLKVDAAYHSEHMEIFADYYLDYLVERMTNKGNFDGVIFSSPTTGKRIATAQELDPAHWVENMVKPVEFLECLTNMCIDTAASDASSRKSVDIVVEVGPHGALSGPIRQIMQTPELKGLGIQYGSCLTRGQDAVMTMQNLAAFLVSRGYPVDIEAVNYPVKSTLPRPSVLHDLPSYPWNHQTRHWFEPRLNRQHRLRKHADHDLLGVRIPGANPETPTWRHIIRQAEVPWVKDHRVQSTVIYPAAGYISMAVEGLRQYLRDNDDRMSITGYRFRDVDIASALIVPDSNDGIEAQLQLRSCYDDNRLGCEGWYEFRISSVTTTDQWAHHCRGYVAVTTAGSGDSAKVNMGAKFGKMVKETYQTKKSVSPDQVFESIHRLGVQHGPMFQNITKVETQIDDTGRERSLVDFHVKDTTKLMPDHYEHDHVLHPTTLDSTIVAAFTALPGAGLGQKIGMIPQHIDNLFISADIPNAHSISRQEGSGSFQVLTQISQCSTRGFMSSSITSVQDTPVLEIYGLYFKSLGETGNEQGEAEDNRLSSTVRWDRDIAHIPAAELKNTVASALESPSDKDLERLSDLKIAAFYFIRHALENLDDANVDKLTGAHRKFYDWMVQQNKLAKTNELGAQSLQWLLASDEERHHLLTSLRNQSVSTQMLCRVGEDLVSILKGEVNPLELMLEGGLLYDFYEQDVRVTRSHAHLQKYLDAYVHKHPRANILELGAGVGGCTQAALQVLGTQDRPLFAHYDFTDVSAGFFSTARERFLQWGDRISYRKLDLEVDPSSQSFEDGTYDLIIACRVLHATKLMSKTMAHVRKLLKPGGKLIIIEDTTNSLDHQVIYGVLPGWWLGEEDDRKYSATMPLTTWEGILHLSGFSGLELEVPAFEEEEYQSSSLMVSTALSTNAAPKTTSKTLYAVYSNSEPPRAWLDTLSEAIFNATGSKLQAVKLGSGQVPADATVLFLEMGNSAPDLTNPSPAKYSVIQSLLLSSKAVLWVTRGAAIKCEQPMFALSHGLLRTLRCENPSKRYMTLDLDASRPAWTDADVNALSSVVKSSLVDLTVDSSTLDFEYAERGGIIQIPRLVESPEMDKLAGVVVPPSKDSMKDIELSPFAFHETGQELTLEALHPDDLTSLAFRMSRPTTVSKAHAEKSLPDDFAKIIPHSFGANSAAALGGHLSNAEDDSSSGSSHRALEIAGTVARVGRAVTNVSPGQRVCGLILAGTYANVVRIPAGNVTPIPDGFGLKVATSLPIDYVTAYSALHDFARIRKGETVLIHNAAGRVGQAAVSLAKLAGAEIIATVLNPDEQAFLSKELDIPSTHIFASDNSDGALGRGVMELSKERGVDVVLSTASGELLRESWNLLAPYGRFCQMMGAADRDVKANRALEMAPFGRMTSFATVDAVYLAQHRPRDYADALGRVVELLAGNKNRLERATKQITTFGISDMDKALQHPAKSGPVIIASEEQLVKVIPPEPSAQLPQNRSYLVVGGMGGIGQSISRHLVHMLGARNLILMSRSAEKQIPSSQDFLSDLESAGCKVCVRSCDVTDEAQLSRAVEECELETGAPVGGVIQAAMVLRDTIFDQMTLQDYTAAVRPKVVGTWNLHRLFGANRPDLSFFIILSSFVGVGGNGGQANYAAGGAFEDALARHRASVGLPGVAIDLGAVKEIGYLVQHSHVADRLAKLGYKALSEREVLGLVEAAIKRPVHKDDIETCQIVTGILGGSEWGNAPWAADPRFAGLKPIKSSSSSSETNTSTKTIDLKSQLSSATSSEEGTEMIVAGVARKISDMFSTAEEDIDSSAPLSRYGVDSLVAVEIRNWLNTSAAADLSIFDVMQSPSLLALAGKVAEKSEILKGLGK